MVCDGCPHKIGHFMAFLTSLQDLWGKATSRRGVQTPDNEAKLRYKTAFSGSRPFKPLSSIF